MRKTNYLKGDLIICKNTPLMVWVLKMKYLSSYLLRGRVWDRKWEAQIESQVKRDQPQDRLLVKLLSLRNHMFLTIALEILRTFKTWREMEEVLSQGFQHPDLLDPLSHLILNPLSTASIVRLNNHSTQILISLRTIPQLRLRRIIVSNFTSIKLAVVNSILAWVPQIQFINQID